MQIRWKLRMAAAQREVWTGAQLQRLLAGDCALPVGVRSELIGERLRMQAILFTPGESAGPERAACEGPAAGPEEVAAELFARLEGRGHEIHS